VIRPARSELYAAAALAALTIAAALGLGRVFDEGSFALPVIGAALLPHAVGAIAPRASLVGLVLGLVTFVVVLLYLAWVIAPGSTTYGIPARRRSTCSPAGCRRVDRLPHRARAGAGDRRRADALHAPHATVATTADLLAFRSEATLAALVPSLLLFVFASTLGTTELQTVTTIGYSIVPWCS
jgi:hypothetical protein